MRYGWIATAEIVEVIILNLNLYPLSERLRINSVFQDGESLDIVFRFTKVSSDYKSTDNAVHKYAAVLH